MFNKVLLFIGATVLAVSATPVHENDTVGASCTISDYDDVSKVVKSCTNIVIKDLEVPSGKALELELKSGTHLTFKGTTKFGYGTHWEGPMLSIIGSKLTVTGASGSVIDGQGAHYWDGNGDSGNKKPKFFRIKTTGSSSTFSNIHLLNCPRQCVIILDSDHTTLTGWNIDVSDGDSKGGKNTDGFDLSASETITIENSVVKNQDDCVAVNSGKNLVFKNLTCSGGHGLSLSIGVNDTDSSKNYAEKITFENSHIINSRNGIHIKTHTDAAKGHIKDITYSNIVLSGVTNYGINVQQDYEGGSSTGIPGTNIPITGLTLKSVKGTMNGPKAKAVYVLCGNGACNNFKWSGVEITGAVKDNKCENVDISGFDC